VNLKKFIFFTDYHHQSFYKYAHPNYANNSQVKDKFYKQKK